MALSAALQALEQNSEWKVFTQYINLEGINPAERATLMTTFWDWEAQQKKFQDKEADLKIREKEAAVYGDNPPLKEYKKLVEANKELNAAKQEGNTANITAAQTKVTIAKAALDATSQYQKLKAAIQDSDLKNFRDKVINYEKDMNTTVEKVYDREFQEVLEKHISDSYNDKSPESAQKAYEAEKNTQVIKDPTTNKDANYEQWFKAKYEKGFREKFDVKTGRRLAVSQGIGLNPVQDVQIDETGSNAWMIPYIERMKLNAQRTGAKSTDGAQAGDSLNSTVENEDGSKTNATWTAKSRANVKLSAEDGSLEAAIIFVKTAKDNGLNQVNFPMNADDTFLAKYMIACLHNDMAMNNAPNFANLQGLPPELKQAYADAKRHSEDREKRRCAPQAPKGTPEHDDKERLRQEMRQTAGLTEGVNKVKEYYEKYRGMGTMTKARTKDASGNDTAVYKRYQDKRSRGR